MESLFSQVKARVTARDAAERYGLRVNRAGMACCVFHDDRHPSMKVDTRYYCFGCHATGDVIDLVGRLFGLRPWDAARKLADDFGISPTDPAGAARDVRPALVKAVDERVAACEALRVAGSYERKLKEWKERYAPATPDETPDERFNTSLRELAPIGQLIDELLSPDPRERTAATETITRSGLLARMQKILSEDHTWTEVVDEDDPWKEERHEQDAEPAA